jgi:hypothetical protein
MLSNLTDLQFILFVIAAFLAVVQLFTLAGHAFRGAGASLIPGIVAAILFILVFVVL